MKPFSEDMRYEYPLTPDSIVFDCGGYKGEFMAKIASKYDCRVICFEPIREYYNECLRVSEQFPKCLVLNMGVSNGMKRVAMQVSNDSSTAFKSDGPLQSVQMTSLPRVLNALSPGFVDLLKLNVEGAEFEVVEQLIESDLIRCVENLQVQWHDVVPDAIMRYTLLQKPLANTHHLTFDNGWVWQNWRRNAS